MVSPSPNAPQDSEPATDPAGDAGAQGTATKRYRPGIYLLPNLLTTGALFAGFYAILSAIGQDFEAAALGILAALILDGFDGRVARMTGTQSDFGAEYDSLSDMVAFGVAPALVAFEWALTGLGKFGWLAAFVYTAGAALRLARFNTQIGIADKAYFQGLPSPAAAALLALAIWIGHDNQIAGGDLSYLMALLTVIAGLLMVSNLRYYSFKSLDLQGRVPFLALVVLMLGFALVVLDPPIVLFLLFLGYALSGILWTLIARQQKRGRRRREG